MVRRLRVECSTVVLPATVEKPTISMFGERSSIAIPSASSSPISVSQNTLIGLPTHPLVHHRRKAQGIFDTKTSSHLCHGDDVVIYLWYAINYTHFCHYHWW